MSLTQFFPPGSAPWLLMQELRRKFRSPAEVKHKWTRLFAPGILILLPLVLGVPLAMIYPSEGLSHLPVIYALILGGCVLLFAYILLLCLTATVKLFFEQGDFDLLFSSPIKPQNILFVRMLTIAAPSFLFFCWILSVFILPIAVFDDARLFGAYGLVLAICLLGTSVAVVLAIGLCRWLGPKRAKQAGVLIGTAGFVAIAFLAQVPQFYAHSLDDVSTHLAVKLWLQHWFSSASLLSWPGEAAFAVPVPLTVILVVSFFCFWSASRWLGHSFARVMTATLGAAVPARRHSDAALKGFSGHLLPQILKKEWRCLLRNPTLLLHIFYKAVCLLPIAFIIYVNARDSHRAMAVTLNHSIFVMTAVLLLSNFAFSMMELIVMGEDAPDLMASAPISPDRIRQSKLCAALIPVGILGAAVLAGMASFLGWWAMVVVAVTGFLCCYSVGYIIFWYDKPQPQKNFRQRKSASVWAGVGSIFLTLLLSLMAMLIFIKTFWAAVPMLLAILLLGLLYACRRYDI